MKYLLIRVKHLGLAIFEFVYSVAPVLAIAKVPRLFMFLDSNDHYFVLYHLVHMQNLYLSLQKYFYFLL